jgi:hypothetical protein
MDCCVNLFYEMVWSCFEKHFPTRFSHGGRNYKETKVAKISRASGASKKRCLEDETIDAVNLNTSEGNFFYSEKSISKCMVEHTTITALGMGLKRRSKVTQWPFLVMPILKRSALASHYIFLRSFGIWP